jgi:hypothetical protein
MLAGIIAPGHSVISCFHGVDKGNKCKAFNGAARIEEP